MFRIKDLGETKQIFDTEVQRDQKNGKLWLPQIYGEDIDEV
jgi:hypothetical protein